jgi:hypothetical protein
MSGENVAIILTGLTFFAWAFSTELRLRSVQSKLLVANETIKDQKIQADVLTLADSGLDADLGKELGGNDD